MSSSTRSGMHTLPAHHCRQMKSLRQTCSASNERRYVWKSSRDPTRTKAVEAPLHRQGRGEAVERVVRTMAVPMRDPTRTKAVEAPLHRQGRGEAVERVVRTMAVPLREPTHMSAVGVSLHRQGRELAKTTG